MSPVSPGGSRPADALRGAPLFEQHAVLPARDVRRELVAVVAAVPADVALEGVAEAVAAHVDGEHDVVQEEDAAVLAAKGSHRFPVLRHHPQRIPAAAAAARFPPGRSAKAAGAGGGMQRGEAPPSRPPGTAGLEAEEPERRRSRMAFAVFKLLLSS